MNSTIFSTVKPERLMAWGEAVRAQYEAQALGTPDAWRKAALAWDALARLHQPSEGDREIFFGLGRNAWFKVVGRA